MFQSFFIHLFIHFIVHHFPPSGFTSNAQSHDPWKIDLPGGGFIEKPGLESRSTHSPPFSLSAQSDEFRTPEVSVNLNLNQCDK